MADNLIRCRDCDGMMSKQAWTCPKCGAPNLEARKKVVFPIIILIVVLVILWIFNEFYTSPLKWKEVEEKEKALKQYKSESIEEY